MATLAEVLWIDNDDDERYDDDDYDFGGGGGGFMEWSPSPSPASTLTHYIHNNKSEMIFLAHPNLYCQAY